MTEKRTRRQFSAEFKADAVRLVLEQGLSMTRVARDLDLAESALRRWVDKAREQGSEALTGTALSPEQQELQRLRRENQILKQEREILVKAAAFFAKESM
jgi:transposase